MFIGGSGPLILGADIALWLLAAAPVVIGLVGVFRGVRDCGTWREVKFCRASGEVTVGMHRWFGRLHDQSALAGRLAIHPHRVRFRKEGFVIGVPTESDFIVLGGYRTRGKAQEAARRIEALIGRAVEESEERVEGLASW
jgi:hypothetical protein